MHEGVNQLSPENPSPWGKNDRPLIPVKLSVPFVMIMLGVDRRRGSAAQGSSFRLPAEISLCIACLSCLGDNFGVINMPFPLTDTFCEEVQWHSLSPVITAMPAGDKTGILWRHIVQTDLENKAVSKHLAIVSLQTQQGSLLYCSTQHTKSVPHAGHTVHELHSADSEKKKYTS